MDNKPLLHDRPPPYSPYGAIPPAPPYPFPAGTGPGYTAPASSQPHNYPNTTYTIIQQPPPTTSVIVVGGCPACRDGELPVVILGRRKQNYLKRPHRKECILSAP